MACHLAVGQYVDTTGDTIGISCCCLPPSDGIDWRMVFLAKYLVFRMQDIRRIFSGGLLGDCCGSLFGKICHSTGFTGTVYGGSENNAGGFVCHISAILAFFQPVIYIHIVSDGVSHCV